MAYTSDWKPVKTQTGHYKCLKCGAAETNLKYRVWESDCGGHEDYHYSCEACGKSWWIDGIDS